MQLDAYVAFDFKLYATVARFEHVQILQLFHATFLLSFEYCGYVVLATSVIRLVETVNSCTSMVIDSKKEEFIELFIEDCQKNDVLLDLKFKLYICMDKKIHNFRKFCGLYLSTDIRRGRIPEQRSCRSSEREEGGGCLLEDSPQSFLSIFHGYWNICNAP